MISTEQASTHYRSINEPNCTRGTPVELPKVQSRPTTIIWKRKYYLVIKRFVDVAIALTGLILLSPVMLLVAVLIRLTSPGPALFVQTRIGKDGKPFRMFKFRTLQHKVDDAQHRAFMCAFVRGEIDQGNSGKVIYKPFHKAQVTPLGRVLRQTSLDELPQLINVLAGDMSLVGPRPNVPWEVEAYKEWHKERLQVLPGITGLAQINGRSGIDFDAIVRYDVEYIQQQSLGLDVRILVSTVMSVISRSGAS